VNFVAQMMHDERSPTAAAGLDRCAQRSKLPLNLRQPVLVVVPAKREVQQRAYSKSLALW
jgi:hypothetical protein